MTDDRANADEGSDPTGDIKRQNPGETTTGDITGGGEDRAGAGEGPDADDSAGDHTTQDAAKAGRRDFDPNAGQE
ncbi:hypothetical protein [Sphingomonas sp. CLY1604]|uniref:hypothetical protein n=1 Tax=Sphingomonas sp. CLY1604 TaxID=3457786 RepID=UPI003FD6CBEE